MSSFIYYTESHYSECHNAECRYAECRGTHFWPETTDPICHKTVFQPFIYLSLPDAETRNLDLRTMRQVFYHCAAATSHLILDMLHRQKLKILLRNNLTFPLSFYKKMN